MIYLKNKKLMNITKPAQYWIQVGLFELLKSLLLLKWRNIFKIEKIITNIISQK